MGRIKTLLKNGWVVVVALVVVFVIGVGAGGLVEHQRLKDKSNKTASAKTTTTLKGKAAAGPIWFKKPTNAACPALKSWKGAASASFVAILKKDTWDKTKTALLAQNTTATSSLKTMLPLTTPAGRAGVNYLVGIEGKTSDALKKAASQADYAKASKALTTPRLTRGNAILGRAAKTCSAST